MAQTMPVYVQVDVTTSGSLSDGSATTAQGVTTGGGALTSGLLWGVHTTLSSTAGQATLKIYSDSSGTRELYSATFDFSGGATQSSDMMGQPIPLFEQPYFTVTGDSTSGAGGGKTLKVNCYIQAMRF